MFAMSAFKIAEYFYMHINSDYYLSEVMPWAYI